MNAQDIADRSNRTRVPSPCRTTFGTNPDTPNIYIAQEVHLHLQQAPLVLQPPTMPFEPWRAPKTPLDIHRVLSPKCGLRVSPLCLGAMSIGSAWTDWLGSINKEESFKLLDAFYEAGGNFIDTANNYQDEQSEAWIGEWAEARGIRDQLVIATKFTTNYRVWQLKDDPHAIPANFGGNHSKSLLLSVRDSLKKLRTDYIDLLYVHWWDYTTSVEELMHSLDTLVKSRQVLYLGISDAPAWIVAKANTYARERGLAQFVVYQGMWNVMIRDMEREIIPMCISEGIAIAPWQAIGGGKFKSKAEIEARKQAGEKLRSGIAPAEQNPVEEKVSAALEKVGQELNASITAVALAYCLQRGPYIFPIIGGRKVEHLKDNIRALEIELTDEHIKYLESHADYSPGFPHSMIGGDPHRFGEPQGIPLKTYVNMKFVKDPAAIRP
jgi:aryl-alcohol dehydrogenase-like predicted oxidoreductase